MGLIGIRAIEQPPRRPESKQSIAICDADVPDDNGGEEGWQRINPKSAIHQGSEFEGSRAWGGRSDGLGPRQRMIP